MRQKINKDNISPCTKCGCITKSIRKERAHYVCGKCNHDKSLSDLCFHESKTYDNLYPLKYPAQKIMKPDKYMQNLELEKQIRALKIENETATQAQQELWEAINKEIVSPNLMGAITQIYTKDLNKVKRKFGLK